MLKSLTIILWFMFCISSTVHGQSIRWTSFEHLGDSLRIERRPLLVFIHTDWCKYCRMQENSTFRDPSLVAMLNENFYCLKLDAESTKDTRFLGRNYKFEASRGYHELAEMLGSQDGALIFPSTVLLTKGFQVMERFYGFQKAENLLDAIQTIK